MVSVPRLIIETDIYRRAAGIGQAAGSAAFTALDIRPSVRGSGLTRVDASYLSARGLVHVGWELRGAALDLRVAVPPGSVAAVWLPVPDPALARESGRPLSQAEGVTVLGRDGPDLRVRITSGRYRFAARMTPGQPVPAPP